MKSLTLRLLFVQGLNTIHYTLPPNYFDFNRKNPTPESVIAAFSPGQYDLKVNGKIFIHVMICLLSLFCGFVMMAIHLMFRYAFRNIATGSLSAPSVFDYASYNVPKVTTGELTLDILTFPHDVLEAL